MKKWVEKFVEQFDWNTDPNGKKSPFQITEDRATLLYIVDTFNRHLMEVDGHPARKVREILDGFAHDLLNPEEKNIERVLFRFRQFMSTYRIDETTYVQKTFDEFRNIIWEFVDQLASDVAADRVEDNEIKQSFDQLKEAVESNSIDMLKSQSRKFIDSYVEMNFKKEKRRTKRMQTVNKNLAEVKKKLSEASDSASKDHLTGAFNRRSYDEHIRSQISMHGLSNKPLCLLMLDIDHFKKINDSYGHPIGDFILKECVNMLHGLFPKENQFVARIGGEEFAVVLSETYPEVAEKMAESLLNKARSSAFVQDSAKLSFTVSIGMAQWMPGEGVEQLMKRADAALYASKNSGRNRMTIAPKSDTKAA